MLEVVAEIVLEVFGEIILDLFGLNEKINKMKFKRKVVPGDRLKLEVKIIKRKGPIGIGEAIATVDEKIVAKGELTFALV